MRVIAGSARRLLLKSLEGIETRPTTDRIKETLFNIINNDLYGCVFIDLFSGSGGIGIEALSRGAKRAVFVEKNKKAAECIKYNLEHTKLKDYGDLIIGDVLSVLPGIRVEHADIIYMDAPYQAGVEKAVLDILSTLPYVDDETLIIIEAAIKTDFSFVEDTKFSVLRIKEYKTNKHLFLKKR